MFEMSKEMKMNQGGSKTWYFADGYLPEKVGPGPMEGHEALMLLNTNPEPVKVLIDVYFEDKDPAEGIQVIVDGRRIKTLRLDNPADLRGLVIKPLTQYALRVRSSANIIAQFGRLDTTQTNMAYYGVAGFHE